MSGTDDWDEVERILNSLLTENDAEKLVQALKTSVKHEFEEILDVYTNKINEPIEILLVGNDLKFMRELIETFENETYFKYTLYRSN